MDYNQAPPAPVPPEEPALADITPPFAGPDQTLASITQASQPPNLPIEPAVNSIEPAQPAIAPAPPAYQPIGLTQKEVKPITLMTFVKLGYVLCFLAILISAVVFISKKIFSPSKDSGIMGEILLETKYQPVVWKDFGNVFEPLIKVPIYYPDKGYEKEEFLLDSGAVVSSLTREKAERLGYSLAMLPRSTFAGFGGTTSFAYKADLKIKLGEQEVTVPVVFTEAAGTKSILGRSGFFENYSVYFNAKDERIEIRK